MIDHRAQIGAGWIQRLRAEAKHNPRTALILTALLVILAAMWARLLLGGGGPGPASAAPTAAQGGNLPAADQEAIGAAAVSAPRTLAEWARQKTGPVTRNLFAVPFDSYPLDPAHPMPQTRESAKSGASDADQSKERQILVESVRAQAAKLGLEGIVLGASPRVWVNGTLVGVGQNVGETGFKVVKIESRRVLVERDGVQVEVIMK